MVKIAHVENPRLAQAFIDYLATRDIHITMQPNEQGFELWLDDPVHQIEAEHEFAQFIANPNQEKYLAASWESAGTQTPQFQYQTPNFLALLKAKAGPITLAMMLICCVIYLLQTFGLGNPVFNALHFPAFEEQKWQLWRWISHALLHFSLMHIAFNLMWWWQLGGDIEKKMGSAKLLQIFVISAAVSGASQFYVGGANFGGLSGVVYALLGYAWILGMRAPQLGVMVPRSIVIFMLAWIVIGFVQPLMAIANSAHLAGLVCGCVLGALDGWRAQSRV